VYINNEEKYFTEKNLVSNYIPGKGEKVTVSLNNDSIELISPRRSHGGSNNFINDKNLKMNNDNEEMYKKKYLKYKNKYIQLKLNI
jgi:hypothetical protein